MANDFTPMYDLEALTEPQRAEYVKNVCKHMGIPDNLNLVMLTYLDEQDGPRRLVAYAKRGATEIIRGNRGINVTELSSKEIGGSIVFTATGKDSTGRQEMSTGSKWITGAVGKELDDAIMTAQTRAVRRMTLQFVGAGVLDESEVNPKQTVELKNVPSAPPAPQPVSAPNSAPGQDITPPAAPVEHRPETPEEFPARMERLRQEAIAAINAQNQPEAEPKTRKPRKSKTTVDLATPSAGDSQAVPAAPAANHPVAAETPQPAQVLPPSPAPAVAVAPPAPTKGKLSPEQIKPYRQRQFKLITELEMAGFAPKLNMGNLDKLRNFVGLMYPEIANFNELDGTQWESYLSKLESKIKAEGAAATIKYIEDAVGI